MTLAVAAPGERLARPELARLDELTAALAAGAAARDRGPDPAFPHDAIALLRSGGVLAWNATPGSDRPPFADELALVRRVAQADGSVGRIFDGHLNAVERLAVQAPEAVVGHDLAAVRAGQLLTGVWGGDPHPGEGPPARVIVTHGRVVLRGVKTFCSGAGGLDRALVLARADGAPAPAAVWIDLRDERVEVDRSWYRSTGLRASQSHRVVFHDVPVIAQFGVAGALTAQPWFARDALRTAASWAGMADAALNGALAVMAQRPEPTQIEGLAAGRMLAVHGTIDVWLAAAGRVMEPGADLAATSLRARAGIAEAIRLLLDEAARACGSGPFARGHDLDRARRDLELFTLQHRLDPMLARDGLRALEALR